MNKFEILTDKYENDKLAHRMIWKKFDVGPINPTQLSLLLCLIANSYIKNSGSVNLDEFETCVIEKFVENMKIRNEKITSLGLTVEEERI